MFTKKSLYLPPITLVLLLVTTQSLMAQKEKRITFRRGASSATVTGKIGNKGYLEYLVNGRAGQLMTIKITSSNGQVIVNAGTASGKDFSVDMSGGDHQLSIVNSGKATTYTLTVSIK